MIPTRTTRADASRAASCSETSVVVMTYDYTRAVHIHATTASDAIEYSVPDELLDVRRVCPCRRAVLPALRVLDGVRVHELRHAARRRSAVLRELRHSRSGHGRRRDTTHDTGRSPSAHHGLGTAP